MSEEIKQYTIDQLRLFYSEDKKRLVNLYKEQFKQCVDSYISQDGLFQYYSKVLHETTRLISSNFGVKYSGVCIFANCFDENVNLLNGKLLTDSDDDLYFIESGDFIKIGRTNNIKTRLSALQTHNAEILDVLFLKHNSGNQEFAIHRMFKYLRVKGEWFKKHDDICTFIELVKQHPNDPTRIQWDKGKVKHDYNYLISDL